jgi:hypothetical protein
MIFTDNLLMLTDDTSYCEQVDLFVTTPAVVDAATVAVVVLLRSCNDCASIQADSTAIFEYQLAIPTLEPGYPAPASGSELGKYFIDVNVRYLVMDGVLPPFFWADFVNPDTRAVTSQQTNTPSLSSLDSMVTHMQVQVPAGAIGIAPVTIYSATNTNSSVSFNFTYLADTTPSISLVIPGEVSALGGLVVQLIAMHLTDVSNGMQMEVMFGNTALVATHQEQSADSTQDIITFTPPFTDIRVTQSTDVQLVHQGLSIYTQISHLPLPQVSYITCSSSSTCSGTAGVPLTIVVYLSDIPLSCEYRLDGCTVDTYLPDCSDTCTDVVAEFGSHGQGLVTSISRDNANALTQLEIQSPPFLSNLLGAVTAELSVHADTRFTIEFDVLVEAADSPTVDSHSREYLFTSGNEEVTVQVSHLQVSQPSALAVTFDSISISFFDFSINSDSTQISFSFLSPLLSDSKAESTVQVVVSNTNLQPSLSASFTVFMEAPPQPAFVSADPVFILLPSSQDQLHFVSILVSNVLTYEAEAVEVNFTSPVFGIVQAQNVVATRLSGSNDQLQFGFHLAADIEAASWDVDIKYSAASGAHHIVTYLIQSPAAQILSVEPGSAYTAEELVISTRDLDLPTDASTVDVKFTTRAGDIYYGLVSALLGQTVTVQVPAIGHLDNLNSIDVAIITPLTTVLLERAFDWKAAIMPTALKLSPNSGLSYGGFAVTTSAEGFVSVGNTNTELAANDFFVMFSGTSITEFTVTETLSSDATKTTHEFQFTAPEELLITTAAQIVVGLSAETFKNVSFGIRIDDAGAPYMSGMLYPSQCYTQGGGSVSAIVNNFPPSTDASAFVTWSGGANVSAQTVVESTSGTSKDVTVTFTIPESPDSATHQEVVSIVFGSTSPPITVSSDFTYSALPSPSLYMNVSRVVYSGGTVILLTLQNLGPRSAGSELVVLFAQSYTAVVKSTSCKSSTSACDDGLVLCEAVVETPQMQTLIEMGNVLVQAYWSDLTISRAAFSEDLEVYNPVLADIPTDAITPSEGYVTENTEITVEVYGLVSNGQHYSESDDIYAYFVSAGSSTQVPVNCIDNQWITSVDGSRNSIKLTMPTYTSAGAVTLTVQLKQVASIKASTSFTYYDIPTTSPQVQGTPLTGHLVGGTVVLLELTSFYMCPSKNDVVVEFTEPSLSHYKWEVDWISSSIRQTSVEAISPLVSSTDVYNSTTGAMKELTVRVYPLELAAFKDTYGATVQFKYKPNTPTITKLEPTSALKVGGIQAKMELENVDGITQTSQLQIMFGQEIVPTSQVAVFPQLSGILSVEYTLPAGPVGLVDVLVKFTDGRANATCDGSGCVGFVYTTLTGPSNVLWGPFPSRMSPTTTQASFQLGLSNFLPVSSVAELTVSCDGVVLDVQVLQYQAIGEESYLTLQVPQMSVIGTHSCVLQQTDDPNPASFNLTVAAEVISVREYHPIEADVSTLMSVTINNVAPTDLEMVWRTGSDWTTLSLKSSNYTARLSQDADGVWISGTIATFDMIDAGVTTAVQFGIRDPQNLESNIDEFEVRVKLLCDSHQF